MKLQKITKFIQRGFEILTMKGGFHQIEKDLKKRYYTSTEKKDIHSTSIIVMVDGKYVHGGLSDRIRGITSIYHFCKDHQIPFYLNYTYPFKMEDYLEPNLYNWKIAQQEISYHPEESEPVILTLDQVPSKLHRLYLNRLLQKHPKKQLHIYTNTLLEDRHYSKDFEELFKPSKRLQKSLTEHANQLPHSYIAMVFRFQQLLGDFKEDGYKILSPNERETLIEKCIQKVEEIHSLQHPDKQVLITSDSTTFLERICQAKEYVHIIPGKVVHMDYTHNAAYEIYMKSFLDMLLLSAADKIYLLQTEDMYHSGFAKRAALLKNKPYDEIFF